MSTIDAIPMAEWRDAVRRSVAQMAQGALGQDMADRPSGPPEGSPFGAFIPLMCSNNTLRVGVVASSDGCNELARKLVGAEGGEALPPTDVADAMCEFLNLIAGAVQKEVADQVKLRIGLPIFVSGGLRPAGSIEIDEQFVQVGEVPVVVTVFRYRRD